MYDAKPVTLTVRHPWDKDIFKNSSNFFKKESGAMFIMQHRFRRYFLRNITCARIMFSDEVK